MIRFTFFEGMEGIEIKASETDAALKVILNKIGIQTREPGARE